MSEKKSSQVEKDLVVTIEYKLTVDDEVIDSSEDEGPLAYLHGYDNILPGLEDELMGMKVGESKMLALAPEDAYGEYDEEAFMDVARDEFTDEVPLEPGVELHLTDVDGDEAYATIVEVGDETVTLDFNHPLAGKQLNFEVKVVDIRAANAEELAHGHPHLEDNHNHQ
jgi:FKBP-type peptidyl-prolyl cis-trans isomerase SlyD